MLLFGGAELEALGDMDLEMDSNFLDEAMAPAVPKAAPGQQVSFYRLFVTERLFVDVESLVRCRGGFCRCPRRRAV
jgi:hypothetical protein